MPRYTVNATVSMAAWLTVEADTPEEALQDAHSAPARDFDYDTSTAEVEFNVLPEVELD